MHRTTWRSTSARPIRVVYVRGRGIVLNEPSVVAIETINGVKTGQGGRQRRQADDGQDARTSIEAIRPLRDGVIADIDVAEQMIKHFIHKVHGGKMRACSAIPEIVICVPSGSTSVERRAIRDAASNAGASREVLSDRGADGRRDRGRDAGHRADRVDGRRHWRRHHRSCRAERCAGWPTPPRCAVGGDKMDEAIVILCPSHTTIC